MKEGEPRQEEELIPKQEAPLLSENALERKTLDSIKLEAPSDELLEKALHDPRVHYVPSLKQRDFTADGGPILNASQYYDEWKQSKDNSYKAGISTFDEFVMHGLQETLQRDLKDKFPVSIRGVALNIGETINDGQSDEVLGVTDVLKLGTEKRGRTETKIPTLRYDAGDEFPYRSRQWLQQSPVELRKKLEQYKDQIFPAVLVYKADKPELLEIYIVDYMDEQNRKEEEK
ncbi:MAG: hypothetical protein ABIJ84_01825 [bacterium]